MDNEQTTPETEQEQTTPQGGNENTPGNQNGAA